MILKPGKQIYINQFFILIIVFVLLIFISTSCKNDTPYENSNVIHVRIVKDPIKLNPITKASSHSILVHQYIFPQICNYNPYSLKFEPVLLEKIPSKKIILEGEYKGMTAIHMKFKSNAKWDDGSSITASDFIFTVKTAKHPYVKSTSWKIFLENIKDVTIDKNDNQSFQVIIDGDYYLALEMVASLQIFPQYVYDANNVMDRVSIPALNDLKTINKLIEKDPDLVQFSKDFNSIKFYKEHISSCGPYEIIAWEKDQYIKLRKKKNYWAVNDPSPYLQQGADEIIFHIIPDEINAITQFKNGKIDVLTTISPANFTQLSQDKILKEKFNFYSIDGMKRYIIVLNHRAPYFKDINIRKALALSIDVDAIIHSIEYDRAVRITGDFSTKKESFNNTLVPIVQNKEKALEYLKKSNWMDHDHDGILDKKINGKYVNLSLNYLASTSQKSQKIALLVKQQAKEIGIDVDITTKPFSKIRNENLKTHDFDLLLLSRGGTVPLSDPYLSWHTDNIDNGKNNHAGYSNAIADKLMDSIRDSNIDRQIPQYFELQKIMYEEQALIPLYEPKQQIIIAKKFKAKCFYKKPGYLINTFKIQ